MGAGAVRFTFLGTGTSTGVPMLCCDCRVCTSDDPRDRRLRSSLLVETEQATVVIDCGPDFRQQMLHHGVTFLDAIVFTHEHKDHTAGLDEIRPFNFVHQYRMPLYLTERVLGELKQQYSYIFSGNDYPGIPKVEPRIITPGEPFELGGLQWLPIEAFHYKIPVTGFRIGRFAYLTDIKTIADDQLALLEGVEVLVLSVLRKKPHIAHLTLDEAVALVEKIGPREAYFTHISHLLGRHAEVEAELPAHMHLAYDGLQIDMPGG